MTLRAAGAGVNGRRSVTFAACCVPNEADGLPLTDPAACANSATPTAMHPIPCPATRGRYPLALCAALLLAPVTGASGQRPARADSAGFVTRLGQDTVAVERVISMPDSIAGEMVDRYPRAERLVYYAHITPQHQVSSYTATYFDGAALNALPGTIIHIDLRGDSAYMTITRARGTQKKTVAVPHGSVPMTEPSWGILKVVTDRALAAHGQTVDYTAAYLPSLILPGHASAHADTVYIETKDDHVRAVVDPQGRILSMSDPGGTVQDVIVRIPWPDLKPWVTDFLARDAKGKALGTLSPRATAKANIGGADLVVDYGQPSRRGRQIFGAVVPWNRVWRTGANEATAFSTSKDITLNGTRIPAGKYTLFSLPTPDNWTLVVSKRTGEWGTEYDSTADFARIPMQVSTSAQPLEHLTVGIAPRGGDGVITIAWDTRVGTLTVKPAS